MHYYEELLEGAGTLLNKNSKIGIVFKTGDDKIFVECVKYVNTHLDEIRANRDFRVTWADTHIGRRAVVKYLINSYLFRNHKFFFN